MSSLDQSEDRGGANTAQLARAESVAIAPALPHDPLASRIDPEILARVMASTGESFVHRAYWVLLGRDPDPSGLANYMGQLASGVAKTQILAELAGSPESQRAASPHRGAAMSSAPPHLVVDPNRVRVATGWNQLFGTHGRFFLACAYQTLLGRSPDPDGLKHYLGELRRGAPKVVILARLRRSEEFSARLQSEAFRDSPQGRNVSALVRRIDWEIAKFLISRVPLIGWLVGGALGVEGHGRLETRLRRLEFLLSMANLDSSTDMWEEEVPRPMHSQDYETLLAPAHPQDDHDEVGTPTVGDTVANSLRSLAPPANWGKPKSAIS